jgi:hypothetical protein
MQFISFGYRSSLKMSFEIELSPLEFNMEVIITIKNLKITIHLCKYHNFKWAQQHSTKLIFCNKLLLTQETKFMQFITLKN